MRGTPEQRIGVYTRISSDDELQGKGVARQREDCLATIKRLGWAGEVVDFEENDTSATRSRVRPVYERLMAEARAGRLTHIVIWDADRLRRTPREAEDLIDLVDSRGVRLANATGIEDLTTSDGRMVFRIKITVARREVEQTSKRLRRSNDQRAAEGWPAGQVGYGFRRVDGRIVTVPEQVDVIRESARRVLAGDSLGDLRRSGRPQRADPWARRNVEVSDPPATAAPRVVGGAATTSGRGCGRDAPRCATHSDRRRSRTLEGVVRATGTPHVTDRPYP